MQTLNERHVKTQANTMYDIKLNERNIELRIQTPRSNRSLCTTKLQSDKCTESSGIRQSFIHSFMNTRVINTA